MPDIRSRMAPSRESMHTPRPRRGAVLVLIAVLISVLGTAVGLVVDLGVAHNERRKEQEAADAAALAAVAELARGQSSLIAAAQANAVAARYGFRDNVGNVSVSVGTPTTGPNANDARFVQVTVSKAMTNLFARVGLVSGARSSATAVAGLVPGARRCLMSLDETQSEAFAVEDNARLTATDCGIMVNSSHANALRIESAGNVSVSGGVSVTGGSSSAGNFLFNAAAPAEPDPLAHLTTPTGLSSTCTFTNVVITTRTTLTPGTYCAVGSNYALDVQLANGNGNDDDDAGDDDEDCGNNGNGKGAGSCNSSNSSNSSNNGNSTGNGVTLAPGRYVFRGGLRMRGKFTTVTGAGVTFLLTARPDGAFIPLRIEDDATIDLTAPSVSQNGGIAGVLVFTDRTIGGSHVHSIRDAANVSMVGALYFPRHALEVRDDGAARRMDVRGGIVARTVSISGNVRVTISRDASAGAALRRLAVAH